MDHTPGISFVHNLQAMILQLWEDNVPVRRIARFVGDVIHEEVSPGAVQNCPKVCSHSL